MKLLAAFLVLFLVVDAKPKKRYSITEGTIGDLKTMTISNTRTGKVFTMILYLPIDRSLVIGQCMGTVKLDAIYRAHHVTFMCRMTLSKACVPVLQ